MSFLKTLIFTSLSFNSPKSNEFMNFQFQYNSIPMNTNLSLKCM